MTETMHQDELRHELDEEAQRIAIDAEYLGRQHLIASEGWRRRATLVAIPATVLIAALAAETERFRLLFEKAAARHDADAMIEANFAFHDAIGAASHNETIGLAHHLKIDHEGNIWVADIGLHIIRQFTPEGKVLRTIGLPGEKG